MENIVNPDIHREMVHFSKLSAAGVVIPFVSDIAQLPSLQQFKKILMSTLLSSYL